MRGKKKFRVLKAAAAAMHGGLGKYSGFALRGFGGEENISRMPAH
jgi:hypothetical protein